MGMDGRLCLDARSIAPLSTSKAALHRRKRVWLVPQQGSGFLLCKSIAKQEMCHFLAPAGQPEMMHKNFMQ